MAPDTAAPHSRACGIHSHPHGARCSPDCPTCGGPNKEARDRMWGSGDKDLCWECVEAGDTGA